eukprot:4445041-Pyramimonas_sp.AAC.1
MPQGDEAPKLTLPVPLPRPGLRRQSTNPPESSDPKDGPEPPETGPGKARALDNASWIAFEPGQ